MDERALKALQASIAHWEEIAEGTGWSQGRVNCPLCHEYRRNDCAGCPAAAAAGDTHCRNTPYDLVAPLIDAPEGFRKLNDRVVVAGRRGRLVARMEVAFLRSLLPAPEESTDKDPSSRVFPLSR